MIWKKFSGLAGLEVRLDLLVIANRKGSQSWREVNNLTLHSVFIPACSVIAFARQLDCSHCVMNCLISPNYKKERVFNQSVSLLLVETKTWSASKRCRKAEERWHWMFFCCFFFLTTFHNFQFQAWLSLLPSYLATSSPTPALPPPPFHKMRFLGSLPDG